MRRFHLRILFLSHLLDFTVVCCMQVFVLNSTAPQTTTQMKPRQLFMLLFTTHCLFFVHFERDVPVRVYLKHAQLHQNVDSLPFASHFSRISFLTHTLCLRFYTLFVKRWRTQHLCSTTSVHLFSVPGFRFYFCMWARQRGKIRLSLCSCVVVFLFRIRSMHSANVHLVLFETHWCRYVGVFAEIFNLWLESVRSLVSLHT